MNLLDNSDEQTDTIFPKEMCSFKYLILFRGVETRFRSSAVNRNSHMGHDSMTQTNKHRYSRGITMIMVRKTVPFFPKLSIENLKPTPVNLEAGYKGIAHWAS